MTVKVVSEGPTRTKRVVCQKCTFELEYTGLDVEADVGCYMGETQIDYRIKCPHCGSHTNVKPWRLE